MSGAVEEAKAYIQSAVIVGADETGFGQGNTDGQNPQNQRAWLWVAVTPLISFFQVMLSRSTAAAQSLLGQNFRGILNGDHYNAYNWKVISPKEIINHYKGAYRK